MKKLATLVLCTLFVICLCAYAHQETSAPDTAATAPTEAAQSTACQSQAAPSTESKVFHFPAGTTVCGTDVSGMIRPDAYQAICETLENYSLDLTVNGESFSFSAGDISLSCPETAIIAYVGALQNGEDPAGIELVTYDLGGIRQTLAEALNTSARNTFIRYNTSVDAFQLVSDVPGKAVDLDAVMTELDSAILAMAPHLSVTAAETAVAASVKATSAEAQAALAAANSYLDVSLVYSYAPDSTSTQYESISKDSIASFIAFENDLTAYINEEALRSYVGDMSSKYSVKGRTGEFKTSTGKYIGIDAEYGGQPINMDALYEDIHHCLTTGTSGNRVAPYLSVITTEDLAFDGNYVEVDLTAQFLWVYRDGVRVVESPIVTGCVDCRNYTPTGVYSIYAKTTNTYLVGDTYRSWVNYWMPFYRGYGLHDANWRNSFGGDNYLHNGSHGCVNIPPSLAGHVYNNIEVGTKVVIYGGATRNESVPQKIIGTAEYKVPLGLQCFMLDAQPGFGDDKTLTYVSSNPAVASVAADGTVSLNGYGTAYITVTAPKRQYYTAAEMIVAVTVYDGCQIGEHIYGPWVPGKPVTCTTDGDFTATCTLCGHTVVYEAKATGHTFSDWVETTPPTCTDEGEQTRTCTACGETETEPVPATGHSYSDWDITDSTCTAPGSKSKTCLICGHTVTEDIPMKDHCFDSGGEFCDNGCGTPNPDYLPPKDEEDKEDEAPSEETLPD